MLGKLLVSEIEELLHRQVTGHLGCHADGETYVVPINYFYKDLTLYAQSGSGKKIDMMRKNPKVCLEVAEIINTFNWKSVVLIGSFEEITDEKEKKKAIEQITKKLMPLSQSPKDKSSHAIPTGQAKSAEMIVFKISVEKRSGRYEKKDPY